MAVNLSPVGGVAAQFFDNSGNVLTGGKIYTYLAGTTTPATTYTTSSGITAWSNPIVLDAAGRVSGSGEVWLTDSIQYKFILKDSNDVLIATYDNITGINSNFVNFVSESEIQTATAGQTVFTLTTMEYQPGTNNLLVFVDGVNQYEGSGYSFVETNSTTVTFDSGLHVGALVKFTTATPINTSTTSAGAVSFTGFKGQEGSVQDLADDDGSDWIGFLPDGNDAVARSAQDKMRDVVSVKDFGAVGDGVTNDQTAFENAIAASDSVYIPAGQYLIDGSIDISGKTIYGDGWDSIIELSGNGTYECAFWNKPSAVTVSAWANNATWDAYTGFTVSDLYIKGTGQGSTPIPATWEQMPGLIWVAHATFVRVFNVKFFDAAGHGFSQQCGGYSTVQNCFFDYMTGNGVTLSGIDIYTNALTSFNVLNSSFRQILNAGVSCFCCYGVLIQGNVFENIKSGVEFSGVAASDTLCRSIRVIANYQETSTKGLVYKQGDAIFINIEFNECDALGDDGSGGSIQNYAPVTAFGNTQGTNGWNYTSTGINSAGYKTTLNPANGVTSLQIVDAFGTEAVKFFQGGQGITAGYNAANAFQYINKDSGTNRSINAAGSVNAGGADYAEYMTKAGDFTIAKGDICGIDSNGMLTNVYADSVSFVVKSTAPSYVGNDIWGIGLNGDELETARQKVDRVAFAGQVPVNVTGAAVGSYIVPSQKSDGGIEGVAIQNPTFEQYQNAVGKVIALNSDGSAKIIVKVI